ncbi:MAG: SpoIIE family protein phosphatase [Cyclobacteriaceae bacterium]
MRLPSILKKREFAPSLTGRKINDASVENYYSSLPESMLISAKLGYAYVINEPLLEVGGDGFWIHEEGNMIYFAVFDCMGHGRMATIMTRLYIQYLEETVKGNNSITPAEILTDLHERVKGQFESKSDRHLGTGADMAILRIDKKKKKMLFSGAKMELIAVNQKEVKRIKSNKRSIGEYFDTARQYSDIEISTQTSLETKYYLFSDGITDLFGGDRGKKLRFSGLEAILKKLSHISILKESTLIKKELKLWEGNNERLDDVLLIGFKVVL